MIRFGLFALHALLMTGEPPVPTTDAPAESVVVAADVERFNRRLEAVDAAMSKVYDLRADFEQRKHTPLLKKPLISMGIVLSKGKRVRWDTMQPRASSLLIDEESIQLFYPSDNLLEVYPAGVGVRDLAGAPLPRLSILKVRFDITQIDLKEIGVTDDRSDLLAIRLTPKSDSLKSHITSVRVLFDESRAAATKVIMTDADGEETEILFSNIRMNAGVKDDQLTLKVPDEVRVSRPLGDAKPESSDGQDEPAAVNPDDPEGTP